MHISKEILFLLTYYLTISDVHILIYSENMFIILFFLSISF